MTSLLDFPSKNWSTCKFLTFWLECKTRNDDFFYQFFRKLREKYERWGTPCCEITYHFQNFYHHFLTTLGHVLTYSGVKTFGPRRIYGISGSYWIIYGRFPPASWTNIMRRQNVLLQSTFPIKLYHNSIFNFLVTLISFYQPEEHPRVSQIYANKSFRVKSLFSNFLCTIKELTRATSNRSKNKQR